MSEIGKVYLIGAGPGDEELLTVKGKRILEQADVVVYDRLIGRGVMELIPERARRIDVGKRAGHHPVPQDEINRILLDQALAGHRVVRLKGGDSFVFGRGGEELELLSDHGVPFEVVPGITSALAAAAYAGIPVTHRDYCSSLHIITGHQKGEEPSGMDYRALAALNGTLVFMMSVAGIGPIAQGLMAAGMDPAMPCAVIENGTLSRQRQFVATVDSISDVIRDRAVKSPAVIVVGRVCRLAQRMDWFSGLPLRGVRILVTQPRATARRLADSLRQLGADVTRLPVIQTAPLDFDLPDLSAYSHLIFTSSAGVTSFCDRFFAAGLDARDCAGLQIAAIGAETARVLRSYGLSADFVPTVFSGEALAAELLASGRISSMDRALIPQAAVPSPGLAEGLSSAKVPFEELAVYETSYPENGTICPSDYDYVTFTSASCVAGFVRAAEGEDLSGVRAVCIGEQTARVARNLTQHILTSKEATLASMVDLICEVHHEHGI